MEAPSVEVFATGGSEGVRVVGFTSVLDDVIMIVELPPSDAAVVMSTVVVSLEVVVVHVTVVCSVVDIVVTGEGVVGMYVGSRNYNSCLIMSTGKKK